MESGQDNVHSLIYDKAEIMKQKKNIAGLVSEIALPLAKEFGYDLWDVEYVKEAGSRYLRVYIDKPDGVSIQDCEDFSRALDPILDEADPIPDSYIFEVSSAGAERQLKRPGDFARFLGAQVEVRLYQPVDGSKVHIGTLEQYDNGDVTVSDGKTRRVFQKSAIAQVRLHLTI